MRGVVWRGSRRHGLLSIITHAAAANKANENGATPLYIACDKEKVDAARLLLDKSDEVNRADVFGRTPLNVHRLQERPRWRGAAVTGQRRGR